MRDSISIIERARQRAWEKFEEFGFLEEDLKLLIMESLAKMKMSNVLNRYMSTREVALRLGIHRDTVRKYCREGQLKGIKIGERHRVREGDLLNFIREREESYIGVEGWENIKLAKRLKLK